MTIKEINKKFKECYYENKENLCEIFFNCGLSNPQYLTILETVLRETAKLMFPNDPKKAKALEALATELDMEKIIGDFEKTFCSWDKARREAIYDKQIRDALDILSL